MFANSVKDAEAAYSARCGVLEPFITVRELAAMCAEYEGGTVFREFERIFLFNLWKARSLYENLYRAVDQDAFFETIAQDVERNKHHPFAAMLLQELKYSTVPRDSLKHQIDWMSKITNTCYCHRIACWSFMTGHCHCGVPVIPRYSS